MPKHGERGGPTGRSEGVARELRAALAYHDAGDLVRAGETYARVVARAPGWAEAWHGFGVLGLQAGEPSRAVERLRRAVELEPRADYLSHLAAALEASGDLAAAKDAYVQAIARAPADVDTLFNAGLLHARLSEHADARTAFERAAALAPADAEVWLNLSRACLELDDLDAARRACERGLDAARGQGGAEAALCAQRGAVARARGALEEAARHYEEAVASGPRDPRILVNLGAVLHELGRLAEAEARYRQALDLDPGLVEAEVNLAGVHRARGELDASYRRARAALRLAPRHAGARRVLSRVLRHAHPTAWDADLFSLLAECYADPEVDPEDLAGAAAVQLRQHPARIEHALGAAVPGEVVLTGGALRSVLLTFLSRSINSDPAWERVLRAWRERLAGWLDAGGVPGAAECDLLAALAEQAFNNEYVWVECPEETRRTDAALAALASRRRDTGDESAAGAVLRVALYRDLAHVFADDTAAASALAARPALERLIRRSVLEPAEERRLAAALPRLGAIENATSAQVRAQYEESPYPRWITLPRRRRAPLADVLHRQFPDLDVRALRRPFGALVAGCGTGQEPLSVAIACPEADVVGIDLSLASLGYAARMRAGLGVSNLRLLHGDLMSVGALGERFELVLATGVLHHMADPIAGWRCLAGALAPRGLMKVGLYSERARAVVVAARELAAARGLGPGLADIRAFRDLVLSGEVPVLDELAVSEDFYTASACRDLVFHACEHRFTLPAIAGHLEALGLELVGIEAPDGAARARFRATDPGRPLIERWQAVEDDHPDTFAGMYQLWVRARV